MRKTLVGAASALLLLPGAAWANCPPMSAYSVVGVSANEMPLADALALLFEGTAWKAEASGAGNVTVTFRNVSGPLDAVFRKVVEQAGSASNAPLSALADPGRCVATVVQRAAASAAPREAVAPKPRVLRAGRNLSDALSEYVQASGWQLRWRIEEDYVLDVDFPMPDTDLIEAVSYVVRAYQAQGGMQGVAPRFAKANRVVVIEPMDVRESE